MISTPLLDSMKDLSQKYPIWLCDIWGVVHNGDAPFPTAVKTLINHRHNGGKVILISNSPNVSTNVINHLDQLGVDANTYDGVITSGDATRELISKFGGNKIFHIGTARDYSLYEGLAVTRVSLDEATSVVCSGLFNETVETANDYVEMLAEVKRRGLTMICANPDIVVQKGSRLLPCAGAIAEVFTNMGGKVSMAGKPYAPIYELATAKAERIWGLPISKSQILAIGDGPATDIQGAADFGVPCVFITGGINSGDDVVGRVERAIPKAQILRSMLELDWA